MQTTLRHRGTGDVKVLDTGWSWSIFLGASFLGLPLFMRGLAFWGVVMLVAWTARLAIPHLGVSAADQDMLEWIHTIAVSGLALFLGFKGNALSVNHYVACGYEEDGVESLDDRVAGQLWDN